MGQRRAVRGVGVVCAALTAALACAPALAASGRQPADKPGGGGGGPHKPADCVTPGEYDKIIEHQTKTSVH
jgi:hypothetical protein